MSQLLTAEGPDTPPVEAGSITITKLESYDDSNLTVDAVRAKITKSYVRALRTCYEGDLKTKRQRTVNATFEVGEHGETTFPDRRMPDAWNLGISGCVEQQIEKWKFPIPRDRDGETTSAQFGLTFEFVPKP